MKSVSTFQKLKNNKEKIAMLTAYDYSTAKVLNNSNIDAILVGDSLAMVMLGYNNTYNITIDEMLIFIKAVSRGAKDSFIIGDMPFMSYNLSIEQGLENAGKMIKAGANAIKLEGCNDYIIKLVERCTQSGIPVLAHIGLTPQLLNTIGGYKVQGKNIDNIENLLNCAKKLEEAGAFAIVLELVSKEASAYITSNMHIPTIGIGSGVDCDGQIVVIDDILGKYTDFTPKFIKKYSDINDITTEAVKNYILDVKNKNFPSINESFTLPNEEREKLEIINAGK